MIYINDPRTKALSSDEETVEVLEVIEQCDDYSDLDDNTPNYARLYTSSRTHILLYIGRSGKH